jgi:BirA family biotin operon repressor/biotin-[acetyl-CoA-carboxylase] ligase
VTLTLPAGFVHRGYDVIDSTNEEARRLAVGGAPDRTFVTATRQTKGRGRQGRAWVSQEGNVLCSLILRPGRAPNQAAQVSFIAALAVSDSVRRFLPEAVAVSLKWPNDVLVGGKKIAGILLESATGANGAVDWLVVGVGINVAHEPGAGIPGVSLRAAGGRDGDARRVTEAYAHAFASWYARWLVDGFEPIRVAWLERAHGVGGRVHSRVGERFVVGTFRGIDPAGSLLLETESGTLQTVAGGEVYFGPGEE